MAPSSAGCCASHPGERKARREATRGIVIDNPAIAQGSGAQMFANRLRKNLQRLGKIARREGVGCWRLYDADMPEYALAVDLYTGAGPDERQALAVRAGIRAARHHRSWPRRAAAARKRWPCCRK